MKNYDLQGVELNVPAQRAFAYIANPANLPAWTNAFASVQGGPADGRALMRTPAGEVDVGLRVVADPGLGTVDWLMTFPDGAVASAYSRVVPLGTERCAYTFVLTPPPVPLEALEGTLTEQSSTLTQELAKLHDLLMEG